MRSIRQTFRGPSVLPKTRRNLAFLLRKGFTKLWRIEIHINLKIDAGVPFMSALQYIISVKDNEGNMLLCAHASTAYAM
jgi:hypothetical protein